MGWGWLGKLGGIIGAPFTGGASLALTALGGLGSVAGGQATGRAQGRADQADFNLRSQQAQQAANVGTSDANIRANDAIERTRAKAMAEALHGTLLQHTQDANITGLPFGVNKPTITGGARPSALGGADERYRLGALIRDPAVNRLEHPAAPSALTAMNFSNLAPKPGKFDKLMNILGTVGAFSGPFNVKKPPTNAH